MAAGCQAGAANDPKTGAADHCESDKRKLVDLLQRLPAEALASSTHVRLPEAALPGSLGSGVLLEISEGRVLLDGSPIRGQTATERAQLLAGTLAQRFPAAGQAPSAGTTASASASAAPTLYLAVEATLNVRTLHAYLRQVPAHVRLRLLFAAPRLAVQSDRERPAFELAETLLNEPDPAKRRKVARRGYAAFAQCSGIANAAKQADLAGDAERWPRLRAGMLAAVRACACNEMQAPSLGHVLVAEQRAGSLALGALPVDFLRDARCNASMPLRSIQKLLRQVEDFDAEFSGGWQNDELSFEKVLEEERLLNYFCDALPGETLAALQRAHGTLYFRVPGRDSCLAFAFQPMSPGAPMGDWVKDSRLDGSRPLTLHYWQGAEEIRVFGPASRISQATHKRKFACEQTLKMTGVDAEKITLEKGQWFFEKAACEAAPAEQATLEGCVANLASGLVAPTSTPDADAAGDAAEKPDTD